MGILLLITSLCVLSEEVDTFLDEYRFNGYTFQWSSGLYLSIGEPTTFFIYPRANLEGVLCGIGGDAILDLHLELHGGGVDIIDDNPDDLPVLYFVTGPEPASYTVSVTALDMLYGARTDSVYVFCAMRPVRDELDILDPVEPDSAIMGE